jgi:Leu/Phe-tRNA-protein transferase
MRLQYTRSGHLYIPANADCDLIVDAILATGYNEDFCIAEKFDYKFIARLMEAGFLVMSANIAEDDEEPFYLLLPKLHLERSVLFFENLHIKKSIRWYLDKYELRPNTDFDRIIEKCVEKHGDGWLTPPLIDCIKKIREETFMPEGCLVPVENAYPASFALYRDGKLVAGDFGVICGKVYTGYSCYHDEDNAGTVRFILAARYLLEQGFSLFDLGMPMGYKDALGAENISPEAFVMLFRG